MKVRIEQIRDVVRELTFVEPVASFPVLVAMVEAGECTFDSSVEVHLTVGREMDHYRVDGSVSAPVQMACSRCLTLFRHTVASRFTLIFTEEQGPLSVDEDEVQLDERDLVSATFSGDEIDLIPEIGEQVALAVPLKPLCSCGCKGLCPACGVDLNSVQCVCSAEPKLSKFAVLKDFKVQR